MLEGVRDSPAVQAAETGWRQDGAKMGMSGPSLPPPSGTSCVAGGLRVLVDEVLGRSFGGVMVSDFYAAYHHYPGLKQRCWAHLLRDIHDLKGLYPEDTGLAQWAEAVHQLYTKAKTGHSPGAGREIADPVSALS